MDGDVSSGQLPQDIAPLVGEWVALSKDPLWSKADDDDRRAFLHATTTLIGLIHSWFEIQDLRDAHALLLTRRRKQIFLEALAKAPSLYQACAPSTNPAHPAPPPVHLGEFPEKPIIFGVPQTVRWTRQRHAVLRALWEAGRPLHEPELIRKSGCKNAPDIVRRLKVSSPEFSRLIETAKGPYGAYSLNHT